MSIYRDISKKIKPLGDRIFIREDTEYTEKKTTSGIILPGSVHGDKGGKRGEIVAVGPGYRDQVKLVPVTVKIGQVVLFQWGDKVTIEGNDYYCVKESEILAIIN